jgi:response regulator RpfG family c-di-GMP phosphodiesterase
MVYLALTVWAAALGLTALLVGTLCDERAARVNELHEAYFGIVEVLSKYLQSGNTKVKSSSIRTAELGQMVAKEMKLPQEEIDDIRIAVLLYDLGGVEITTRLIRKAVSTLEANPDALAKHTFLGMELVHSLGSVLHSVVPLLVDQDEDLQGHLTMDTEPMLQHAPIGAQIIRLVRAYEVLATEDSRGTGISPEKAIKELRNDIDHNYNQEALNALERVLGRSGAQLVPALA